MGSRDLRFQFGEVDFDHPIGITGEGRLPKQYISFAVGYMRGLLHNL